MRSKVHPSFCQHTRLDDNKQAPLTTSNYINLYPSDTQTGAQLRQGQQAPARQVDGQSAPWTRSPNPSKTTASFTSVRTSPVPHHPPSAWPSLAKATRHSPDSFAHGAVTLATRDMWGWHVRALPQPFRHPSLLAHVISLFASCPPPCPFLPPSLL